MSNEIDNGLAGLSNRARNALYYMGIHTKEAAEKALLSGKLNPKKFYGECRNYGKKSHEEVLRWVGLPYDPCEKTTKLKVLAELCRAIDDDTCLIDVQCARDEELLNQWRAAWKELV